MFSMFKKKIVLSKMSTIPEEDISKEEAEKRLEKIQSEIAEIQKKFHADGRKSILVILQWMDASWKDGTVRKVFSGINPMGLRAIAFWKPSDEEFSHDFLWRIHKHAPEKWMITIFNRSHYEDILVPSVEWYLSKELIENRYDHIRCFERMLVDEGTIVLKFFLHMSKDEQAKRFKERITLEHKFWKYDPSDTRARERWDDYMDVYERIFEQTNFDWSPWHVIPADVKWYRNYKVAEVFLETIKKLELEWPQLKGHNEDSVVQEILQENTPIIPEKDIL